MKNFIVLCLTAFLFVVVSSNTAQAQATTKATTEKETKCEKDCKKECCAKKDAKKCEKDCKKECCVKKDEKKCAKDCKKACCATPIKEGDDTDRAIIEEGVKDKTNTGDE